MYAHSIGFSDAKRLPGKAWAKVCSEDDGSDGAGGAGEVSERMGRTNRSDDGWPGAALRTGYVWPFQSKDGIIFDIISEKSEI